MKYLEHFLRFFGGRVRFFWSRLGFHWRFGLLTLQNFSLGGCLISESKSSFTCILMKQNDSTSLSSGKEILALSHSTMKVEVVQHGLGNNESWYGSARQILGTGTCMLAGRSSSLDTCFRFLENHSLSRPWARFRFKAQQGPWQQSLFTIRQAAGCH